MTTWITLLAAFGYKIHFTRTHFLSMDKAFRETRASRYHMNESAVSFDHSVNLASHVTEVDHLHASGSDHLWVRESLAKFRPSAYFHRLCVALCRHLASMASSLHLVRRHKQGFKILLINNIPIQTMRYCAYYWVIQRYDSDALGCIMLVGFVKHGYNAG